jgi:hypothetical protein
MDAGLEGPMSLLVSAMTLPPVIVLAGSGLRRVMKLPLESCAWEVASSVVVGIAFCGVWGSIATLIGLPVTQATLVALLTLSVVGILGLRRVRVRLPSINSGLIAAGAACMALVVIVGVNSFSRAVLFGDEVYVWGYKAVKILATQRIDPTDWTSPTVRGPAYPPSLPVAGSVAAFLAGGASGHVVRVVTLTAFIGYVAVAYEFTQLIPPRQMRGACWFGISALPIVVGDAPFFMADILFTLALLLAALSVIRRPGTLEAAISISLLPLLKLEGLAIAGLLICVNAASAQAAFRMRALVLS